MEEVVVTLCEAAAPRAGPFPSGGGPRSTTPEPARGAGRARRRGRGLEREQERLAHLRVRPHLVTRALTTVWKPCNGCGILRMV